MWELSCERAYPRPKTSLLQCESIMMINAIWIIACHGQGNQGATVLCLKYYPPIPLACKSIWATAQDWQRVWNAPPYKLCFGFFTNVTQTWNVPLLRCSLQSVQKKSTPSEFSCFVPLLQREWLSVKPMQWWSDDKRPFKNMICWCTPPKPLLAICLSKLPWSIVWSSLWSW